MRKKVSTRKMKAAPARRGRALAEGPGGGRWRRRGGGVRAWGRCGNGGPRSCYDTTQTRAEAGGACGAYSASFREGGVRAGESAVAAGAHVLSCNAEHRVQLLSDGTQEHEGRRANGLRGMVSFGRLAGPSRSVAGYPEWL